MHWTRRVGLLCLCLLSLGWCRQSSAQEMMQSNAGVVFLDDFSGSMSLGNDGGTYMLFQKMIGDGVGFNNGFSRIGLRTKLWDGGTEHLFGEVHTLITDDSRIGFSTGGGYRWLTGDSLIGVNSWYDNTESNTGYRYQQIGFGAEYLTPLYDLRGNAYIPVGDRENLVGIQDFGNNPIFRGNTLGTNGIGLFERAYYGVDVEGGVKVPYIDWLRTYAGMYYLTFSDDDTLGFRGRAEARVNNAVSLNFLVTDDNKFGTNVNLDVEVRFSGRLPTQFGQNYSAIARRYDQVRRNWPVQLHVERDDVFNPLKNPTTGNNYNIVWVDNTAAAGGNGSFENPYTQLPGMAGRADLVLVRSGMGDTQGSIQLVKNQQLLGEGAVHVVNTNRLGLIELPDVFSQTGPAPTLVGNGGGTPIVQLANNNVVSNFNLDAQNGIFGQNIIDYRLDRLTGTLSNGINIQNGSGDAFVRDINFALAGGGNGIVLTNTDGQPLRLEASDITLTGGNNGLTLGANGANILFSLDNYTGQTQSGSGLVLMAQDADLTGSVNDTTVSNLGTNGVSMMLDNATGTTVFTRLQANENMQDGLHVVANNGSDYNVGVVNSHLDSNFDDNIDVDTLGGSNVDLSVDPTYLTNAGQNGLEFNVDGGSNFRAQFERVTMSGSGIDAVNGNVMGGSSASLSFTQVNGTGSADDGFDVRVIDDSSLVMNLDRVNVSDSGGSGIVLDTTNSSWAIANMVNVISNDNGEGGFDFRVTGGPQGPSEMQANIADSSFFSSDDFNIRGRAENGSVANLSLNNVAATHTDGIANVLFVAHNAGKIRTNWTGGTITNSANDGVRIDAADPVSQVDMVFDGVAIDHNAGDGINASLVNGSSNGRISLNLANSSISDNSDDGIDLALDGDDAMGIVTLANTPIENNVHDALQFDVTSGADLVVSATGAGNSFSNNGSNAIQGIVDGAGSSAQVTIDGANADNSGHAAALFSLDHGAALALNVNNSSMRNSGRDGIFLQADRDSTAILNLTNVALNQNGQDGMGTGSGLSVNANRGSDVGIDWDQVAANSNREKGFNFIAANGSTIIASPDGAALRAVNNGEEGLAFDVQNGSMFQLNAVGTSFSDNGQNVASDNIRGFISGTNSAASVSFDGITADNSTLHGFDFEVEDNGSLIAEIIGGASASGNAGNGIRVNAANANAVAVVMEDSNVFSNNGASGLTAIANGTNQFALQASGAFSDNAGNGLNIQLNDVGTGAISVIGDANSDIDSNGADGLAIALNNTILDDIEVTTLTQTVTVSAFDLNTLRVNNSGGTGISLIATDSTIADGGSITNSSASDNGGDGILLQLTNSTANEFLINGNVAQNNDGNGINIDLVDSIMDDLSVGDNTIGQAGVVGVNFLMDGFTGFDSFALENTSTSGIDITGLELSLPGGFLSFNTSGTNASPFQPQGGTDVTAGLVSVNGNAVIPGTNPLLGTNGVPLPGGGVTDGSTDLALLFDDFASGESALWSLGVGDFLTGDFLVGSDVSVSFSNGTTETGQMVAIPGNGDAAAFIISNISPMSDGNDASQNTLNGIRISADNSSLANLKVEGNVTETNGQAGISINAINGSAVSGVLDDNQVNGNGTDGVALHFTDSSLNDFTIDGNTIESNGGDGILMDFNNSPVTNLAITNNPDINDNGANGINFQMNGSNINGLLVDNNGFGTIIPPPPGGGDFDIDVTFSGGLTPSQQAIFADAAAYWESVIVDDVPDIGLIDDLVIDASGVFIDGVNGILGQAGPTGLRPTTFLPFQGIMQFDSADLDALEASGELQLVILHEMGHVLGFGTIWDNLGLLQGAGSADPRFTGTNATNEYNAVFGLGETSVPLENTGGPGTADAHWRESVFNNELMTGFLNSGEPNPVSRMTIGQWEDLGYGVDYTNAQPYPFRSPLLSTPTLPAGSVPIGQMLRNQEYVADTSNLSALNGISPALALGTQGLQSLASLNANGANGINISLTNSDLTGGVISRNIITNNANGDGIRIVNPTTQGSPIQLDFQANQLSSNSGDGINIVLGGNESMVSKFTDNEINLSGIDGLHIDVNDNADMNVADFSRNTMDSNGGIGVHITAYDNSNASLTAGATGSIDSLNTIANSHDAGIGFLLADNATGQVQITNTNVTGTTDGPHPDFNGEGLGILTTNSATITNLQIGDAAERNTIFSGNAGDGIRIFANLNSTQNDPSIVNVEANANGQDGLNFLRIGNTHFGTVTISDSDLNQNLEDGIDIRASLADVTDTFIITNNVIGQNAARGISLRAEHDADLVATISGNMIGSNGSDGIQLTSFQNAPAETPSITADILDNEITDNFGSGVAVGAPHDLLIDGNVINRNSLDGIFLASAALNPADPTVISNNDISNNGFSGIEVANANNTVQVTGNTVNGNGVDGFLSLAGADSTLTDNDFSFNVFHGIHIAGGTHTINDNRMEQNLSAGMLIDGSGNITANDNFVELNGGDGIQLIASDSNNLTFTGDGNESRANSGRGLNVLVRGNANADVRFNNGLVEGNILEGVYVVTTASNTQSADALATDPLNADGSVFNDPLLVFQFNNNDVSNNGIGSGFEGAGLVMRVGTSGASTAGNAYEDNGGFVSNGTTFDPANLTGRSGVLAQVNNNSFTSNAGVDVLFESFVSTVAPIVTQGTWDATNYEITSFEQDPLARLDLFFTGNTGDEADVTRLGGTYASAEDVFKSRTTGQPTPGPFTDGSRDRNSQRLAFNGVNGFGDFSDPAVATVGVSGDSENFLFSGVGDSTFRVSGGSDTSGFTGGDDFTDQEPIPGAVFGELPFGWGSF